MIVLDASVLANVVGDDGPDGQLARDLVAAAGDGAVPDLADVETVAVLRKRWLAGTIDDGRFEAAIEDLAALPLRRYPTLGLMRRAFELRANVTAYDATYVALAEALACDLVTADVRLSRAPGLRCHVRTVDLAGP
jgi:predicted nucleic acid-binding protein